MDLASDSKDIPGWDVGQAIDMPSNLDDLDALLEASELWDMDPLPTTSIPPDLTAVAADPNSLPVTGTSSSSAVAIIGADIGQQQRRIPKKYDRLAVGVEKKRIFGQRQKVT